MATTKLLKKVYSETETVLDAGRERIKYLYSIYDKVIVNFSGGKDSLAMLYLTIDVAREIGKLPVDAIYIDHEIEGLGTVKLLEEVYAMPEVNFVWYALPFRLRNASSSVAPYWYPWHPAEKEIWCREKPAHAVTELEGGVFEYDKDYMHPDGEKYRAMSVTKSMDFQEISDIHLVNLQRRGLSAVNLVGIRAEESMARYSIMVKKPTECYFSHSRSIAYPIYDWCAKDVWKYIKETGLPYNTEYDMMNKTEHYNQLNKQRVGSVFAEESLRTLHQWRTFYGDFWHLILDRAEGVKTAWRYNNDGIYTGTKVEKEAGVTWEQYCKKIINGMSAKSAKISKNGINKIITWHNGRTDHPIADCEADACPLTGISWEFLTKIAVRGDTKERNLQKVTQLAGKAQERSGMTRDQAVEEYGNTKYKLRYNESKKNDTARRQDNAIGEPTVDPQDSPDTKPV